MDWFARRVGMTIFFVSRHPGAIEWAVRHGIHADVQLTHLESARVGAGETDTKSETTVQQGGRAKDALRAVACGDTLLGTLPVNLAAEVCAHGARYFNLTLNLPETWRGRELSADDLVACDARLEEFFVEKR